MKIIISCSVEKALRTGRGDDRGKRTKQKRKRRKFKMEDRKE